MDKLPIRFFASYMLKNIIRTPVKRVLLLIMALFTVAAPIWLRHTIAQTRAEVERWYASARLDGELANAAIRLGGRPLAPLNNNIGRNTVHAVRSLARDHTMIDRLYIQGAYAWTLLLPPGPAGGAPDELLARDAWTALLHTLGNAPGYYDQILAPSCLETFIADNAARPADLIRGAPGIGEFDFDGESWLHVHFAEGYGFEDFFYRDSRLQTPVPVVVHEHILERRGLRVGDIAFIGQGSYNPTPFFAPVHIIGSYDGWVVSTHPPVPLGWYYVFMPLRALEIMRGEYTAYNVLRLYINPEYNRQRNELHDILAPITEANRPGLSFVPIPLSLFLNDAELRLAVTSLQDNLTLLEILYPVSLAVGIVLTILAGILFMYQNAKRAALLRALGVPKTETRVVLGMEQLVVYLVGIAVILAAMPIMDIAFGPMPLLIIVLLLTVNAIGIYVGAVLVTNKMCLELLQVRE